MIPLRSRIVDSCFNKHDKTILGKFTMVSQPIDLGWLVVCSGSFDLILFDTLVDVMLKLHHPLGGYVTLKNS